MPGTMTNMQTIRNPRRINPTIFKIEETIILNKKIKIAQRIKTLRGDSMLYTGTEWAVSAFVGGSKSHVLEKGEGHTTVMKKIEVKLFPLFNQVDELSGKTLVSNPSRLLKICPMVFECDFGLQRARETDRQRHGRGQEGGRERGKEGENE